MDLLKGAMPDTVESDEVAIMDYASGENDDLIRSDCEDTEMQWPPQALIVEPASRPLHYQQSGEISYRDYMAILRDLERLSFHSDCHRKLLSLKTLIS